MDIFQFMFTGICLNIRPLFFLGNHDYPNEVGDYVLTAQTSFNIKDILKNINYYNYIELDGVKLGTALGGSQGEAFINVWGNKGSYATRCPEAYRNAQTIKILKGCQFPSYENPTGKVYEVQEDIILIRGANGAFINTDYLIDADDITISQATDVGEALEMIMFEISYANWNSTRDSYDFNYFGAQFTAMRKNIFINGVSLWDINTTVDDSGYNYATGPWSNGDAVSNGYQIFQNPTLVRGEGNKLMIYVHKDYLDAMGINTLTVTVAKNFCHSETPAYVVNEDITATVWQRPFVLTLINGNPRMGGSIESFEYFEGAALELVDVFLNTDFEGERHQRRVDLITEIENNQ